MATMDAIFARCLVTVQIIVRVYKHFMEPNIITTITINRIIDQFS